MSISSFKGYLEQDIGLDIIRDIPTLKQLRQIGCIGSTATSAAIFPIERLVQALAVLIVKRVIGKIKRTSLIGSQR
jgi:hypothetical protein